MTDETTKFQVLLIRQRDSKKCDIVRSLYLNIARKEFGSRSRVPEESAPEFELEMWNDKKTGEWPFSNITVDWIRYRAYALVNRIRERMKYAKDKEPNLTAEALDHAVYESPSHDLGPEPITELSDLEEKIFQAAAKLSGFQNIVFFKKYRENKEIGEIAGETGKPPNLVSKALDNAELRVRAILKRMSVTWDDAKEVLNDVDRGRG